MPPEPLRWDGTDAQGNPLRWDTPGLTWDGFVREPPTTRKKMPQLRVQLGFTNAADHSVVERAEEVAAGLYVSPLWTPAPPAPVPPVTLAALNASSNAFSDAMARADMGGPADTALKNNLREDLIALLRKLAGFVQENHDNDLAKLLASGFEAVSTNRAQSALPAPEIRDILHALSGQFKVRVAPVPNAKNYEVQSALIAPTGAPGPWSSAGLFSNSQSMLVNGLTPGAEYLIRVRAMGGSTGTSDWSATRNQRAM